MTAGDKVGDRTTQLLSVRPVVGRETSTFCHYWTKTSCRSRGYLGSHVLRTATSNGGISYMHDNVQMIKKPKGQGMV